MKKPRCIAICYIQDGSRIFIGDGYDPNKKKHFYRPLGGGIEWRENARDAVIREFREEMNAELKDLKFETIIENVFTYDGVDGHEIVLIFSAQFTDKEIYKKKMIPCVEDNGLAFNGVWIDLDKREDSYPIYPEGFLEYIESANQAQLRTATNAAVVKT